MPVASEDRLRSMFPDAFEGETAPAPTTPTPPAAPTSPAPAAAKPVVTVTTNTPPPVPVAEPVTPPAPVAEPAPPAPSAPAAATTTAPTEEVEIDEGEYAHFQQAITADADAFIAKYVSERKAKGTMQSQRDKLIGAVGREFAEAVSKGEIPSDLQRVFTDMLRPELQEHLADFYREHQLKDGKYVRLQPKTPPAAVLQKFMDLNTERANLSAASFMPEGSEGEFDANEALTRPGTASGVAYSKFLKRSTEIESELNRIIDAASSVPEPSTITPERQMEAGRRALDALSTTHPELRDPVTMNEFNTYVQANANNLLEVLFRAFRAENSNRSAVRKLVVRELDTIAANRQSASTVPTGSVSATGEATPAFLKNVDPKLREVVAKDAAYFGDY